MKMSKGFCVTASREPPLQKPPLLDPPHRQPRPIDPYERPVLRLRDEVIALRQRRVPPPRLDALGPAQQLQRTPGPRTVPASMTMIDVTR